MLASFEMAQRLPGGFRFPTRMTALPLQGGALALVSPTRVDHELARRIAAMGEVRFLIAPNRLHHLYMGEAMAHWPAASVLAPGGLRAKRPDLRIDHPLEEELPGAFAGSIRTIRIDGAPKIDEFAFFHEPTGTLVVADLVFNVTNPRGPVAHLMLFAVGCHGRLAQSRVWRSLVEDRAAAAASARSLLAMRPEALIMAHGDVVTTGVQESLAKALAWMCAGGGQGTGSSTVVRESGAAPGGQPMRAR